MSLHKRSDPLTGITGPDLDDHLIAEAIARGKT